MDGWQKQGLEGGASTAAASSHLCLGDPAGLTSSRVCKRLHPELNQ